MEDYLQIIPKELVTEILYYLHIDYKVNDFINLLSSGLSGKVLLDIIQNKYFWINKFNLGEIPKVYLQYLTLVESAEEDITMWNDPRKFEYPYMQAYINISYLNVKISELIQSLKSRGTAYQPISLNSFEDFTSLVNSDNYNEVSNILNNPIRDRSVNLMYDDDNKKFFFEWWIPTNIQGRLIFYTIDKINLTNDEMMNVLMKLIMARFLMMPEF